MSSTSAPRAPSVLPDRGGETAGDPDAAIRTLYAEHWAPLLDYVTRLVRDRHQAEDIAQETMLRAWRNADSLDPQRGSLWGWLTRVARNLAVDRIRARQVRPAEVNESAAAGAGCGATPDHSDGVVSAMFVAGMLARLSREQRAVLHQVYLANRTCVEAAEVLGIPVGTVKSRLYHAIRRLKTEMDRQQRAADWRAATT